MWTWTWVGIRQNTLVLDWSSLIKHGTISCEIVQLFWYFLWSISIQNIIVTVKYPSIILGQFSKKKKEW